jgi:hypothetical protein
MTVYIVRKNKVTAHETAPVKSPKDALIVRSVTEIVKSDIPGAGLIAIWNALPGHAPITKFQDRKTAARRLWDAFAKLVPVKTTPRVTASSSAISKQARVIAMLDRAEGATVNEIVEAMCWQPHTVRGMISAALKKKLGLEIVSANETRGRVYRIANGEAQAE